MPPPCTQSPRPTWKNQSIGARNRYCHLHLLRARACLSACDNTLLPRHKIVQQFWLKEHMLQQGQTPCMCTHEECVSQSCRNLCSDTSYQNTQTKSRLPNSHICPRGNWGLASLKVSVELECGTWAVQNILQND